MQFLILSSLCVALLRGSAWGVDFPFGTNFNSFSQSSKFMDEPDETLFSSSEVSSGYNASVYREDAENMGSPQTLNDGNTSVTDQLNSTLTNGNSSPSPSSNVPSTSSIRNMETLTAIFNNESHSPNSTHLLSDESSATTSEGIKSISKSTILTTSLNNERNVTSSTADDDEPEGVARGKPSTVENTSTTTSKPKTLYARTWALINDTYTLSILIPVSAGVVFATTIMLTIAICRCLRRRCLRRRLRRKTLPDSVKNLRPSDRARLLAESSDEEF